MSLLGLLRGILPAADEAPAVPDRARHPARGAPREVLRQVRRIELRTRGVVDTIFSGEYSSVFKGQGMEFAEVREYEPGDDVRTIDWNVTARMAQPYVKKHVEERELTVLLAVDLSGSKQFGTRGRVKAELAAEIGAVLALSAVRNNDRVGLLLFTDRIEHVVPPRKGRRHVLRLVRDLLAYQPKGRGTDLAGALDYAVRILPHRSIVFMLSDFLVPATPQGPEEEAGVDWAAVDRMLRLGARRHDLVALTVQDAAEFTLPDIGVVRMLDPETGRETVIDTGDPALRERYGEQMVREREAMQSRFQRLGIDEVEVRTGSSYVRPLLSFFRKREREQRR